MAGTTTPQDVFDLAMGLMDEISSGGASDTSDTAEYKNRTLRILSVLQNELYPYSDTYVALTAGTRPVLSKLTAFTSVIGLDDYIAQTIMPCGLVSALLLDENPSLAGFYQQRYEELKATARNIPSAFAAIEDVYGITDYSVKSDY